MTAMRLLAAGLAEINDWANRHPWVSRVYIWTAVITIAAGMASLIAAAIRAGS